MTGRRNEERIAELLPEVGALAREHLRLSGEAGVKLLVVFAYRSFEAQAALFAKGRTAPGSVVTNARAGRSWHNFRRAYDVAVVGDDGSPDWNDLAAYRKAGAVGKALGLIWGGDFVSVKGDWGHFEYHPGITLAQARDEAGLTDGGMK